LAALLCGLCCVYRGSQFDGILDVVSQRAQLGSEFGEVNAFLRVRRLCGRIEASRSGNCTLTGNLSTYQLPAGRPRKWQFIATGWWPVAAIRRIVVVKAAVESFSGEVCFGSGLGCVKTLRRSVTIEEVIRTRPSQHTNAKVHSTLRAHRRM
jgi:hypothetical protein